MERVLGITKKQNIVAINIQTNNFHILATGKSGCGKTTFLLNYLINEAGNGKKAIIFNWRNCVKRDILPSSLKEKYEKYVTVIDVAKNGIPLPLFTRFEDENGEKEKTAILTQRVTSLLKTAVNLSKTHENEVFKAVNDIYENNLYPTEGLNVVNKWLLGQKTKLAENTAAKLRGICGENMIYDGDIWDEDKQIIEFDLNGLEYDDQIIFVRFLLDYFLRIANKGVFLENGINILLDEAQNFEYNPGSTLYTAINESRKLNLNLLLAMPSVVSNSSTKSDVLTQCGTILYFEPIDKSRRKTAELISSTETDSWVFFLSRLKRGECIACGKFTINNDFVLTPVIIQAFLQGNDM